MLNNECSQSNSRCIEKMTANLSGPFSSAYESLFRIDAYDDSGTEPIPKYVCKNGEPTIKFVPYDGSSGTTMTLSYQQNKKGKETIKMIFSTEEFIYNPIILTRDDGGPPPSSSGCTASKCAPDQHTLGKGPKWWGCECHNTAHGCGSTNPCAVWPGGWPYGCNWFEKAGGWNQFLGKWTFKNPTHFSPKSQPKPMHLVPGILTGGDPEHMKIRNALAIGLGVGLGVGIPVLLTLLYYLTKTKRKSKRK